MSLEQLSKTVDFVQATTPSNANDGETYLDTSQSPPQLKIFDSNAGTFVRPRSIQNLDVPVSSAGATQSDIETAVDNSTTASTINSNLDAKISNAGKTATSPESVLNNATHFASNASENNNTTTTFTLASGSGFIVNISANTSNDGEIKYVRADGSDITNLDGGTLIRFENNVKTRLQGGPDASGDSARVQIDGIFD